MKKFGLTLVILTTFILLSGCSKKTAITYNEFKEKSEKEKYTVVDVKDQFGQYDYVKGAYLAVSSDATYQIEFYTFENSENAKAFYDLNKPRLESEGVGSNIYTNADSKNYNKYTLTTDEKYNSITRIDNTIIYSSNNVKYKDKITNIIKKLGY